MSQMVDEEYLRELDIDVDDMSDEEKADKIIEVQGVIMEQVINRLRPIVPNLDQLFDEAKQEFKTKIRELHASRV